MPRSTVTLTRAEPHGPRGTPDTRIEIHSFNVLAPDSALHIHRQAVTDLLVLLDCAEVSRLGRLRAAVERARPRIAVVDHHLGSELGDGDVAFVDVDAAATGELVHRLFKELGRDLTVEAAEGIFVSLVSDTGWFRYSNTSSRVFAIAAELAEIGVALRSSADRYQDADAYAAGRVG